MIRHLLKLAWHRKRANALVIAEIAVSFLVLLAVTGTGAWFAYVYALPTGFDRQDVWSVEISRAGGDDAPPSDEARAAFSRLLAESKTIDGVREASLAFGVPYDGGTWDWEEDHDGVKFTTEVDRVSDDFDKVLGIRVVAGRWFEPSDDALSFAPVVVSLATARSVFHTDEAVGKKFPQEKGEPEKRVVGIVREFRKAGELSALGNFTFSRLTSTAADGSGPRFLLLKVGPGSGVDVEQRILDRVRAVAPTWSFQMKSLAEMRALRFREILVPLLVGAIIGVFLLLMVGDGARRRPVAERDDADTRVRRAPRGGGLRRRGPPSDPARDLRLDERRPVRGVAPGGAGAPPRVPAAALRARHPDRLHGLRRSDVPADLPVRILSELDGNRRSARGGSPQRVSGMILIVDDDDSVTASLGLLLRQHGHETGTAGAPDAAVAAIEARRPDLVLQDMNFSLGTGGEDGLALLGRIRARWPDLPVILITAWGSIPLAVRGMKAGASDFVSKPWSNTQLVQAVDTALALAATRAAEGKPASRRELDAHHDFSGLVGQDPRFLRILELVGRVAPTDASVLITGDSGTGKELIAEAIHRNSRRIGKPFVKVNLGGVSSTLFESEMFGHVRGAFTDARENRRGRFEVADQGTMFLDEIGDLDASSQVKLLRVLQDRSYEVLGSSSTRTVDVRVVSATNRALPDLVAKGIFREDLYYRLNLISIRLPSLAERRGDVPLLAATFLERAARTYAREAPRLSPRAVDWLQSRPWPGNVRELRQTIERAVLVLDGDLLDAEHFRALDDLERSTGRDETLPAPGAMTLPEMERAMIEKCLRYYDGNVTRAAEALGLSRAALYRRLEKHGLDVP